MLKVASLRYTWEYLYIYSYDQKIDKHHLFYIFNLKLYYVTKQNNYFAADYKRNSVLNAMFIGK